MPYTIEILSVGGNFDDALDEAAQYLNCVQTEFSFRLLPDYLRRVGDKLTQASYCSTDVFILMRDLRVTEKGNRDFLIALIDKPLESPKSGNIFGSSNSKRGLAVFTLRNHRLFVESTVLYITYYLIRYALGFVCRNHKNHAETRSCFFDRKRKKNDLARSIKSGRLCDDCLAVFSKQGNRAVADAVTEMVKMMKTLPKSSLEPLPAGGLKGKIDVGIISIREDEFEAVFERFSKRRTIKGTGSNYQYAEVTTATKQRMRLAMTRTAEVGQNQAQAITSVMINDLAPKWIFLVGIGGGFPSDEFTLGDVMLAQRMHDFSVNAKLEGKSTTFQDQGGPMELEVVTLIKDLVAVKDQLGPWNTEAEIKWPKIEEKAPRSIKSSNLYGNEKWRKTVLKQLQKEFPKGQKPRDPKFFSGAVATSNTLVKDTKLVTAWQKSARSVLGVEMELGGVYTAARFTSLGKVRVLAIRGLSDIVGYKRNPAWTAYACHSAASFASALIRSGLIPKT